MQFRRKFNHICGIIFLLSIVALSFNAMASGSSPHSECSENKCVNASGSGENECFSDSECLGISCISENLKRFCLVEKQEDGEFSYYNTVGYTANYQDCAGIGGQLWLNGSLYFKNSDGRYACVELMGNENFGQSNYPNHCTSILNNRYNETGSYSGLTTENFSFIESSSGGEKTFSPVSISFKNGSVMRECVNEANSTAIYGLSGIDENKYYSFNYLTTNWWEKVRLVNSGILNGQTKGWILKEVLGFINSSADKAIYDKFQPARTAGFTHIQGLDEVSGSNLVAAIFSKQGDGAVPVYYFAADRNDKPLFTTNLSSDLVSAGIFPSNFVHCDIGGPWGWRGESYGAKCNSQGVRLIGNISGSVCPTGSKPWRDSYGFVGCYYTGSNQGGSYNPCWDFQHDQSDECCFTMCQYPNLEPTNVAGYVLTSSNNPIPINGTNQTNVSNNGPVISNIFTVPSPIVNNGSEQNIAIHLTSDQSPWFAAISLENSLGSIVATTNYYVGVFQDTDSILNFDLPSGLSDGNYQIRLNASNSEGNSSIYFVNSVLVNTTQINPPINQAYFDITPEIPFTVNNNGTVQTVFLNGSTNVNPLAFSLVLVDSSSLVVNQKSYNLITTENESFPFNFEIAAGLTNGNYQLRLLIDGNLTSMNNRLIADVIVNSSNPVNNQTNSSNDAPTITGIFTVPSPIVNNGSEQNIAIHMTSDQSPWNALISMTNSGQSIVTAMNFVVNTPADSDSVLNFVIPSGLSDGNYQMKLTASNLQGNSSIYFINNVLVNTTQVNPPVNPPTNGGGGGNGHINKINLSDDSSDSLENGQPLKVSPYYFNGEPINLTGSKKSSSVSSNNTLGIVLWMLLILNVFLVLLLIIFASRKRNIVRRPPRIVKNIKGQV